MNGWQMAMELYRAMPTSLADRRPMNDTTGVVRGVAKPITDEEIVDWRQMRDDGLSVPEIAKLCGRWPSVVRRYLSMEGEV
jgi:hypothetical protein